MIFRSNFGSSISTNQMESEWAMALYNNNIAGANRNANENKKSTKTCNKKNARCVTNKTLKCSAPATQGFNYNVLQFKPGPIDCSMAPKVWRVGSACAGMLTSQLRDPVATATRPTTSLSWYCEIDPVARKFLDANFPGTPNFFDACSAEFMDHAPAVDLLEAGFPCQPWNQMGLGGGVHDQEGRGIVWLAILRYVNRTLPRVVILENVKGLTHQPHNMTLLKIVKMLRDMKDAGKPAYSVFTRILNSRKHGGVPQDRQRLYIVAIRKCGRTRVPFS